MKKIAWGFIVLIAVLGMPMIASAVDGPGVTIPKPGEALQGLVIISGNTALPGFQSAEISFNYLTSSPNNWFLIRQSTTPVRDGALAVWDTTTIADGSYRIRIRILLPEGKYTETIVGGLRVRNYTPIETNTPAPSQAASLVEATATAVPMTLPPRLTSTPFPPNPITVKPLNLVFGWIEGAVAVLIGLGLLGLYLRVKRR